MSWSSVIFDKFLQQSESLFVSLCGIHSVVCFIICGVLLVVLVVPTRGVDIHLSHSLTERLVRWHRLRFDGDDFLNLVLLFSVLHPLSYRPHGALVAL